MKKQIIIGVIVISIVFLILAFIINFLIQIPAKFEVVGGPVNWLMFWPAYISAAASSFVVYVTYLSLKQNQKQLDEMKRQWDEDHKKELVAYLVRDKYFYLCIKNTSIVPIANIHASITHIPSGQNKPHAEFLNNFDNSEFSIEAGGCRYINTYVLYSIPPAYTAKSNEYDPDDYLEITLAFDNGKEKDYKVPFKLAFSLGRVLKDKLNEVDGRR